jgi:hypothetical protein
VSEHVEKVRGKLGATNRASAVYVFFVKLMGRHTQEARSHEDAAEAFA